MPKLHYNYILLINKDPDSILKNNFPYMEFLVCPYNNTWARSNVSTPIPPRVAKPSNDFLKYVC